jgi:hypothetical protein
MLKDLLKRERLTVSKFLIGLVDGLHGLNVVEDFKRFCPCVEFFIVHTDHLCRMYCEFA